MHVVSAGKISSAIELERAQRMPAMRAGDRRIGMQRSRSGLALFVARKTRETAEIAGRAAALFEMYRPGSIMRLNPKASSSYSS